MTAAAQAIPSMAELLEQSGHRVCGRRFDCVHCAGSSRFTGSFNDEVAYCHRCGWRSNATQLGRAQGHTAHAETESHRLARARAEEFAEWVDRCERVLYARHRFLWRRVGLARTALRYFPDMPQAWDALADYHHEEAKLCAALDSLSFERAGRWLEYPTKPEELFRSWLEAHASR
jgi:hypothetical protein